LNISPSFVSQQFLSYTEFFAPVAVRAGVGGNGQCMASESSVKCANSGAKNSEQLVHEMFAGALSSAGNNSCKYCSSVINESTND